MKLHEIRERAFAMPLTNPAYPPGTGSIIYMGSVHSKEASVLKGALRPRQARRPGQRHLPRVCANAARAQADPGAGKGARDIGGHGHQSHAQGIRSMANSPRYRMSPKPHSSWPRSSRMHSQVSR
jgi:hypothetical protein